MTQRITMKQLELLCERINKLAGTPLFYCNKVGATPFKANIGHYHLEGAYGGTGLSQVVNEGGGISRITGYMTKRELYYAMHAFIDGMNTKKKEA